MISGGEQRCLVSSSVCVLSIERLLSKSEMVENKFALNLEQISMLLKSKVGLEFCLVDVIQSHLNPMLFL